VGLVAAIERKRQYTAVAEKGGRGEGFNVLYSESMAALMGQQHTHMPSQGGHHDHYEFYRFIESRKRGYFLEMIFVCARYWTDGSER